jgi:hypothetical protein
MGEVGEVGERDVLGVVVVQVGPYPLHPLTLPSERGERVARISIAPNALRQHEQQQCVPFEPGSGQFLRDVEGEKKLDKISINDNRRGEER